VTYASAGEAVRDQNKRLKNTIQRYREEYCDFTANLIEVESVRSNSSECLAVNNDDALLIKKESGAGAAEVYVHVDNPEIRAGEYYVFLSEPIAETIIGLRLVYNDGTRSDAFYLTNSDLCRVTVSKDAVLNYITIIIPDGTVVNFSGTIMMKDMEHAALPSAGDYTPKYIPKVVTKDCGYKKWVAVGDSITYGYTADTANANGDIYDWEAIVCGRVGLECVNLGVSGKTTAGLYDVVVAADIPADVDVFTIMGGTNDFSQNVPIEDVEGYEYNYGTYPGAIRKIVKHIMDNYPNADIILCSCVGGRGARAGMNQTVQEKNDLGLTTQDYANKCREIAHELCIPFLDVFGNSGISILNRSNYISDEVHPTVRGYNKLAQVFTNYFRSNKKYN
jgi:lysophospholipase L1-like esterase